MTGGAWSCGDGWEGGWESERVGGGRMGGEGGSSSGSSSSSSLRSARPHTCSARLWNIYACNRELLMSSS